MPGQASEIFVDHWLFQEVQPWYSGGYCWRRVISTWTFSISLWRRTIHMPGVHYETICGSEQNTFPNLYQYDLVQFDHWIWLWQVASSFQPKREVICKKKFLNRYCPDHLYQTPWGQGGPFSGLQKQYLSAYYRIKFEWLKWWLWLWLSKNL